MASIIQFAGDPVCKARNEKSDLELGVDIPRDAISVEFKPVNGDENLSNYSIVEGKLCYLGEAITIPDLAVAKKSILYDENIPDEVFAQILPLKGLLHDYADDPEGVKYAWLRLKRSGAVPSEIAKILEAHCSNASMPLV